MGVGMRRDFARGCRNVLLGLTLGLLWMSSGHAQVSRMWFWAGSDRFHNDNYGTCQPNTGGAVGTCIYGDPGAACSAVADWSRPTAFTAGPAPQYANQQYECRGTPPVGYEQYYPGGLAGYALFAYACPLNSSASGSVCVCNSGFYRGGDGQSCVSTPPADPGNYGGCPVGLCSAGNPINPGIGNKYQVETDYAAPGPFAVQVRRTYNSTVVQGGVFGARWRVSFDRSVARLQASSSDAAAVHRADGKIYYFDRVGGVFVARADVADRLVELTSGGQTTGYQYTGADGDEVETYDAAGHLSSTTNREGLTQTFGRDEHGRVSTVTDAFGRQLSVAYDIADRVASITDPAGGVYQYAYDSNNNLVSVTYPDTRQRTYQYNESANTGGASLPNALTGITDENSIRYATYKYDSTGRGVSSEHAGGANLVTLSYGTDSTVLTDALSTSRTINMQSTLGVVRIASITGPACPSCGPLAQSVDANGNISSRTDWNGNRTDYSYDLTRNLETQRVEGLTSGGGTTPQTRTISSEWHASFRLPTRVAEPLRITTYTYNGDGGANCGVKADNVTLVPGVLCSKTVQATTDASGSQGLSATLTGGPRTVSYTYNKFGQVLTVDGPRTDVPDVTTYAYYVETAACPTADGGHATGCRGQLESVTDALGHATQYQDYKADGQPLRIVDPNGLVTTLAYDARQRLTSRTVGSEPTSYDYDFAGQLTRVTLPDSSYLSYTYDDAHRLTGMQDNLGNRIAYTLDAMGNRTQEQVYDPANALAQTRSRVYNSLNRLFRELGAQSQTTEYGYDNNGNVLTVTDPLLHVTSNQYDALNRLKQVTDPNLGVTQYAYNGLDALTQVTDPRNLATGYTVDGLGNLTAQASPDTGTTSSTYDAAGNLLTQTDAKNQITAYAYDALNRVSLITFHDGSKQAYAYDQGTNGIGRLSSITETDPANQVTSVLAYAYDQHGRVTSETRTLAGIQYVTGYTYDGSGRLTGMAYPGGRTLTYTLDALGRISQIDTAKNGQSQTVVSAVAYQPFGGVKGFSFGNGSPYTRSYDQDGRIATYTLGTRTFGIGYDAASRIEFIADTGTPANTNTYGYDALDRLTSAVTPSTPYSYGYDGVGNRLSKTAGAGTENYTYSSSSNRIATVGTRSFIFDANGSTTNDGLNTYAYDTRGRMVQATSSIGATAYQVNALGQRVRKTNSQADRVFHYDTRGRLIAETDPGGGLKREFIYLGDIPVGVVQ
jgi:YD repeat-containing protein